MLDSGCTNLMTGEKNMFISFQPTHNSQENIVFGENGKREVMGPSKISFSNDHSISDVLLINSLSYYLFFVSQLCETGYNCLFMNEGVTVFRREDSSIAFTGRLKGKLYLVDFTTDRVKLETCLMAKSSMGWFWHRRLVHVGMRNLSKLLRGAYLRTNECFV